MRTNAYQNYLANEILTADPLKLVILLYRGALDSIAAARRHLAAGDILARSKSIMNAVEIVAELNRSLDLSAGGSLAPELARLYEFAINSLLEGNRTQVDKPLADAERVLATLQEAWLGCQQQSDTEIEADKYAQVSCAY